MLLKSDFYIWYSFIFGTVLYLVQFYIWYSFIFGTVLYLASSQHLKPQKSKKNEPTYCSRINQGSYLIVRNGFNIFFQTSENKATGIIIIKSTFKVFKEKRQYLQHY